MERIVKILTIIINVSIVVSKILCILYNIIPIYKILELRYLQTHIILGVLLLCFLLTIIINIYNILKKNIEEEFRILYNFKIIVYLIFLCGSIYLFILEQKQNYPKILIENIYLVCVIVFLEIFLLFLLNFYILCFVQKKENQILPF